VIFSLIIGARLWRYLRTRREPDFGESWRRANCCIWPAVVGLIMVGLGLRPRWVHFLWHLNHPIPSVYLCADAMVGGGLLYALIGLFMAGVSLRAMGTVADVFHSGSVSIIFRPYAQLAFDGAV
jgi:hypothetical protein